MYRVLVTSQAKKELRQLKKKYQEAIIEVFEELQEVPRSGKPLTRELTGKFSYRVGVYRVIYMINDTDKTIYILTAGHRSEVYNK
jgi:mRNA interferase RelE/StbE